MMVVTPAIQNLIRENKVYRIDSSIQTGRKHGMFLLDENLFRCGSDGLVDKEEVLLQGLTSRPSWPPRSPRPNGRLEDEDEDDEDEDEDEDDEDEDEDDDDDDDRRRRRRVSVAAMMTLRSEW